MGNENEVTRYAQRFHERVRPLIASQYLITDACNEAFWLGFHKEDRVEIGASLAAKCPEHPADVQVALDYMEIYQVAWEVFFEHGRPSPPIEHAPCGSHDGLLRLCARITHVLTCYKLSAYRSRRVPYLLPDSAFMCTTGPFLPDYTARVPPSVTISVLN